MSDLADLLNAAYDQGWDVRMLRRSSHYRLRCPHPCRCQIHTGSTPSDLRAIANLRADLARCTQWETR